MPTDAPFTPPRKKPNVLWWIGAAFLLLLALFCYQLLGPNPAIVVSPQTTHITEPLGSDGLPDFTRYVLDRYRQGATPENNAAVLMWRALGRGDIKPRAWGLIAVELGLDPSAAGGLMRSPLYGQANRARIAAFVRQQAPQTDHEATPAENDESTSLDAFASGGYGGMTWNDVAEEAIDRAQNAAWTSDQLPPLAAWLNEKQEALDLLVEASGRSRFYSPSASLLENPDTPLVSMSLDGIAPSRDVARVLLVRAMWHLGEGRHEAAWRDLLAIHRWARLVRQDETLIGQLVAIAIAGIADQGTLVLLGDKNLPADVAREIQRDLAGLSPPSRMAESFDTMERLWFIDTILLVQKGGMGNGLAVLGGEEEAEFDPMNIVSVDWNVALRKGNQLYDRLAAACRITDHAARRQSLATIEFEVEQMGNQLHDPTAWVGGVLSLRKRSDVLAGAVISLTLGAIQACADAEDRAATRSDMTRLAVALAVYRAVHGQYPETLDALVPDALSELPVDRFHAKPFVYRRDGAGYLLYSTGENGTDDGGSSQLLNTFEGRNVSDYDESKQQEIEASIPDGSDDNSIRVPRPAFKLPSPPGNE